MDWKEKIKEKLLEHSVAAVLALIVLLLSVIWLAVPSEVWGTASGVIPKRVLWALLGLALIVICFQFAWIVLLKRSGQLPHKVIRFGVTWDRVLNPFCPGCDVPLSWRKDPDGKDLFDCTKCEATYALRDDDYQRLTFHSAKAFLRGEEPKPVSPRPALEGDLYRMYGVQWDTGNNPLCPACDCLMPIHHREDEVDVLWCPRCKTLFSLWEDSGERVSLETAKSGVAFFRQ